MKNVNSKQLNWSPKSKSKPSVQDPAKFFRREKPDTNSPSSISRHKLPVEVQFYVREGLQNHFDASQDPKYLSSQGISKDSGHNTTTVTYIWKEYFGREKFEMLDRLGIDRQDIASRAESLDDSSDPDSNIRKAAKSLQKGDKPLTLLYAVEESGSGMYHSKFDDDEYLEPSRLYAATLDINESDKHATAGGSYGQGKTALFAASSLRLNYVYTDYRWHRDSKSNAALLGIACWPTHRVGKSTYSGYSYIADGGVPDEGVNAPRPFFDEQAHNLAEYIGFPLRTSSGSSILVVEPNFTVEQLEMAVLANWWPALLSGSLNVNLTYKQQTVRIDPRTGPLKAELAGFCSAYDAMRAANAELYSTDNSLGELGAACVVQAENVKKTFSYVAKMRQIGLIVEYQRVNAPAPNGKELYGCFMANAEAGELLRMTENKGHTTWQRLGTDQPTKKARDVEKYVREQFVEWSKALRGASSSDAKTSSLLASLLSDFMNISGDNKGRKPPVQNPRPKNTGEGHPLLLDPSTKASADSWMLEFRVKKSCVGNVFLKYAVDDKATNLDIVDVRLFCIDDDGHSHAISSGPSGYIFKSGVTYAATAPSSESLKEAELLALDAVWEVVLS